MQISKKELKHSQTKHNLKALDFFCGGGGMTCGLRKAGINVLAGIDFDIDCKKNLRRKQQRILFYKKRHIKVAFYVL